MTRLDKRHFLRRDEEGVASTVGTIMALLVFMTFLSMFTNSYIPVWMQDNERAHMSQAINQFGDLKGKIDNLIVTAQVTGSTSIHMYSPIPLGAAGIPVFASPTAGLLTYSPQGMGDSGVKVCFNYSLEGSKTSVSESGGGMVELYAPNRYYVQQWVAYENGAMIVKQQDGQIIRAYPSLEVEKIGSAINIKFTQIDFIGTNASVGGTGTVGLNLNLVYIDSQDYAVGYLTDKYVNITLTTRYWTAWQQYLGDLCSKAGLILGDYSLSSGDYSIRDLPVNDNVHTVTLKIVNAGMMTYNRAFVNVGVQI
jgi:hypothetical protein